VLGPLVEGEMSKPKKTPAAKPNLESWITSKSKREILSFLGGGLVIVVGAAWAFFQYVVKDDYKVEVTYNVCFAPKGSKDKCPSGTVWVEGYSLNALPDPDQVSKWARQECSKYGQRPLTNAWPGPAKMCGCFLATVKCSNS